MQEVIGIWDACRHANIAQLLGKVTFQGHPAAVYEWVKYAGILPYLQAHPMADRNKLSAHICEGVKYLHGNGIIHGNLKGSKVLVSSDGIPQILLCTTCTSLTGGVESDHEQPFSIRWAAPELVSEESKNTFASDVYSLGMTILASNHPMRLKTSSINSYLHRQETVTMAVPYHAAVLPERPWDAIPDTEAGNVLWWTLCACWSKEPEDRPKVADLCEVMNSLSLPQSTDNVLAHHKSELSMAFTDSTCVQDMTAFFIENGLTNYTKELEYGGIKSKLDRPYLATPAAVLYQTDLSIKASDVTNGAFRQLTELSMLGLDGFGMGVVLHVTEMSRKVTAMKLELCFDDVREDDEYGELERLFEGLGNALCLRELYISLPFRSEDGGRPADASDSMERMGPHPSLEHIHISGIRINKESRRLCHSIRNLASIWPNVRTLSMPSQHASIRDLEAFATLPCLRHLTVNLNLKRPVLPEKPDFERAPLETLTSSGPVRLSARYKDLLLSASALSLLWPSLQRVTWSDEDPARTQMAGFFNSEVLRFSREFLCENAQGDAKLSVTKGPRELKTLFKLVIEDVEAADSDSDTDTDTEGYGLE
ncbi:hypothetical protein RSAG8_11099, partial [Rhizoctonia solani AG-8 WAC10335]